MTDPRDTAAQTHAAQTHAAQTHAAQTPPAQTGPARDAGGTEVRPSAAAMARTTAVLAASAGRMADPERWRWVPPSIGLPEDGRLADFDRVVDTWFASRLRDRPVHDAVFYAASAVGDHGLLWLAIAGLQAIRRRDANWRRRLLRASAGLGIESALVNGPVKWMFRRRRPVQEGPRSLYLRQPRTSSFPSGHATAAFFAAAILRDDDPWWPLYYGLAVIVAGSRVHVRIHHASDVVGGAILGTALGELTRLLVPIHPVEAPAPRLTLVADDPDEMEPEPQSPGVSDR